MIGGKYRIEGLLGEGGMGVVYAARHEALGQEVAIKFLLPDAARTEDAVARFLREARTAAALKSEHVARVIDMGTHENGSPYLVMERLIGGDLSDILAARKAIPAAEAVDYVLQACDAIAEAHTLGIVHRDLKPSNLFVTRRPNGTALVKILDFGISKVNEGALLGNERGKLTTTGAVMGSPVYMSPEQVRSSRKVDSRSDIWSLGVVLHELASGRHPFEAETVSGIMAAIAADPPVPLREHRPDAPPELEAVVLRCLEKDLTRRLPDIAMLVAELRPIVGLPRGESVSLIPGLGTIVGRKRDDDPTVVATGETEAVAGRSQDRSQPRAPDPFSATQGAWGGSTAARNRRRLTTVGVVAAVTCVGAVGVWKLGLLASHPAASDVASSSPSEPGPAVATAPAETAQTSTTAPAPTASVVVEPAPQASASASSAVPPKRPPAVTGEGTKRPFTPRVTPADPRATTPTKQPPRDPLSDR
jgi:serine/threonine-protein kinase